MSECQAEDLLAHGRLRKQLLDRMSSIRALRSPYMGFKTPRGLIEREEVLWKRKKMVWDLSKSFSEHEIRLEVQNAVKNIWQNERSSTEICRVRFDCRFLRYRRECKSNGRIAQCTFKSTDWNKLIHTSCWTSNYKLGNHWSGLHSRWNRPSFQESRVWTAVLRKWAGDEQLHNSQNDTQGYRSKQRSKLAG